MGLLADVTAHLVIQDAVDAISLGSLYALFALGIAVIFGIMRLINFAHGELIMAGAYVLVLVSLPVVLLIPLTLAVVVAVALVMERVAFRPVRDAPPATLLITSFALSYLLQNAAALTWGSLPRTTAFASGLDGSFTLGQVAIQKLDVVIIGVTLTLLAVRRAVLPAHDPGHSDAGRGGGLQDGPRARDPGQHRRGLGLRPLGAAGRGRGHPAHGPDRHGLAHDRREHRAVRVHRDDRRAAWGASPERSSAASRSVP